MQGDENTGNTPDDRSTERRLEHGGRLATARRRFPDAPEPFIDLSTGINPTAYPIGKLAPDLWTRLPEPEAETELQLAAAHAYRLADPAMVVAAPGTQILISLLPHLLPYRDVAIVGPTYGEHLASWRGAGATVREVANLDDGREAECVVLCNPNNPDGRRLEPVRLLALADRLAARGGMLVVDEAFADFEPSASVAPALPHPAILILRSFGKAYGLAGLRLGFALTARERAARLRDALGPWAISGPAAEIGRHALRDRAWTAEQSAALGRSVERLDAVLMAAGLQIAGGTKLFRLAESTRAACLFDRLGRAGLLVRRFGARPDWLRFGLPATETAWCRLETALHG